MRGDMKVSMTMLARTISAKSVRPCEPTTAERHTGNRVGGTTPFGAHKRMPVFAERSFLELSRIDIIVESRGLLVGIQPPALGRLLLPVPVEEAILQ
jgi:prolyl-tRNA editing enzyme YbaK/EbsC (Cys-tRNA(Pro) deacylase)